MNGKNTSLFLSFVTNAKRYFILKSRVNGYLQISINVSYILQKSGMKISFFFFFYVIICEKLHLEVIKSKESPKKSHIDVTGSSVVFMFLQN